MFRPSNLGAFLFFSMEPDNLTNNTLSVEQYQRNIETTSNQEMVSKQVVIITFDIFAFAKNY